MTGEQSLNAQAQINALRSSAEQNDDIEELLENIGLITIFIGWLSLLIMAPLADSAFFLGLGITALFCGVLWFVLSLYYQRRAMNLWQRSDDLWDRTYRSNC